MEYDCTTKRVVGTVVRSNSQISAVSLFYDRELRQELQYFLTYWLQFSSLSPFFHCEHHFSIHLSPVQVLRIYFDISVPVEQALQTSTMD